MSISKQQIPADPGSYLLWLFLAKGQQVEVGSLGNQFFRRGWYGYCGSAFGPGGLRARLRHHQRLAVRCHWHIDYLRRVAEPKTIWLQPDAAQEHLWAGILAADCGAAVPVPGFGSSDCQCISHLVYLSARNKVDQSFQKLSETGEIFRVPG